MEYLSEKTSYNFILNISPDYKMLQEDIKTGKIQIADFSPGAYGEALLEINDSIKYIVTLKKKMGNEYRDYYNGYVFSRKDTKVTTLKDLKGKSFGFVSKTSSSGYKYPMMLLKKNKIDPGKYFSQIFYLGSHTKVTEAVANKMIFAGATADGTYLEAIEKYGDIFKIIKQTPPIPLDAWAANKNVDNDFIENLKEILLKIPGNAKTKSGKPVFVNENHLYGFVERDNDFYNVVIETILLLKDNK